MFEPLTPSTAAPLPAQACATPSEPSATMEVAAVILSEISAIAEAEVAATETDSTPWAVAEDEERHHEADDLVAELKIQLKSAREHPEPAVKCQSDPSKIIILKNLSTKAHDQYP